MYFTLIYHQERSPYIMQFRKFDANLIIVLDALLQDNSVTLAAEKLGRSPSAISHALAKLRYIFKDQLFIREGQKLVPTQRSKEIKQEVRDLVTRMENLIEKLP